MKIDRRDLITAGLGFTAASLLNTEARAQSPAQPMKSPAGRRKLGRSKSRLWDWVA